MKGPPIAFSWRKWWSTTINLRIEHIGDSKTVTTRLIRCFRIDNSCGRSFLFYTTFLTLSRQQIDEFATMSFLNNQENIIFIGSPGVGKTHLSIWLGIETCRQGVRTLFINCHESILRLKAAQEKQHLERVMRRYERYNLLIIDELGYLPISANEAKLLFQLINGRYERKSTIITTNVPLSSWGNRP